MKQPLQQLQTIYDLAKLLDLADLGFDAEDVADAAWLAQFMPAEPVPDDAGETAADDSPDAPIIERREGPTTEGTLPVATAPATSPQTNDTENAPPEGIPIQIPAAPALRARRDLAKALRPLMRKVPSRTTTVFDAEATTEHIAEQGIWTAVMTPAPERWFELVIVVEQSRSTPLWQDTLAELKLLAERQGAFRRVSTWQIQMQSNGPVLNPKWHPSDTPQPACNPKTLIDPAGRRLIWLVSDCTSALWQQPQIYHWLKDWGKQCPTALVQLFPGRLWWRTALGDGVPVRLSAYTPGVPNTQLKLTEVLPFGELAQTLGTQQPQVMQAFHKFQQETLATVPVVSLEAYPLNQWARVIAAVGDVYTPGYSFNEATLQAYRERKQATPTSRQLSPQERVQQFQKTASETAFKLAGLMAAAPVSPPIIQLIQQTLLPESQQVHVAEVYMSGLLRAVTPADAKLLPHQIQYDFLNDEIREHLTDYVPIAKTEAVLDAVSAYISERLGLQTRTYEALLLRNLEGRPKDQEVVLPFARIAKRALRRLGSDYAELADYIDAPERPKIPVPPQPPKDFPELKTFEFEYPVIHVEEALEDEADDTAPAQEFDPSLQTVEFETVRVDAAGTIIERIQGTARSFVEALSDEEPAQLEMVAIPGGTFLMGSAADESGHRNSESPQHEVTVPAFFMAKYLITQAQWRAVAALELVERDLRPDPARFKGDNRPVERVSWEEATEFCARLARQTGRDYRLPTEAEWEYACRAGTTTPFAFGETLTAELANYEASQTFAKEAAGQYRAETTPVGSFPPNQFGLYDMHGNVWEWCEDVWHDSYAGEPPRDGSAWLEGGDQGLRLLRGGAWYIEPRGCRSANRNYFSPDLRDSYYGFRVVWSAART